MHDYYFTFRSITRAQRAEQVLLRMHLSGKLLRSPKFLSIRGCGYALKIRSRDAGSAANAFRLYGVKVSGIYLVDERGNVQEVRL